jgi:hypothetical protein
MSSPFSSACAADEVVIGFSIRAGLWTDAIASICAKFTNRTLGAIRILPVAGGDGGNPQQLLCPTNHVAIGVVGNYGHSNRYNVDQMTGLGIVCRDIANPENPVQIVAVPQAPLDPDAGSTSFREDCTMGRWLTTLSGTLDYNSVSGQSVVRFGGECAVR